MRIHDHDNVEVNLENGHKYAIYDIKKGSDIIKYGQSHDVHITAFHEYSEFGGSKNVPYSISMFCTVV